MKNTRPKKNPCVVFATQKNPGVFHRLQKTPFGQNVRPKKILRTHPSLKYVSGAPGVRLFFFTRPIKFLICVVVVAVDAKASFCHIYSLIQKFGFIKRVDKG